MTETEKVCSNMTKTEILNLLKKLRNNDFGADAIYIADEAIKYIEGNCKDRKEILDKIQEIDQLKSCPFCGSNPKTIVDYDQVGGDHFVISTYVRCPKCGVYKRRSTDMKDASFTDFENVFAQTIFEWNERVN